MHEIMESEFLADQEDLETIFMLEDLEEEEDKKKKGKKTYKFRCVRLINNLEMV